MDRRTTTWLWACVLLAAALPMIGTPDAAATAGRPSVRCWQLDLRWYGSTYDAARHQGLEVRPDGVFSARTRTATRRFQRLEAIAVTGSVTAATAHAMESALKVSVDKRDDRRAEQLLGCRLS